MNRETYLLLVLLDPIVLFEVDLIKGAQLDFLGNLEFFNSLIEVGGILHFDGLHLAQHILLQVDVAVTHVLSKLVHRQLHIGLIIIDFYVANLSRQLGEVGNIVLGWSALSIVVSITQTSLIKTAGF